MSAKEARRCLRLLAGLAMVAMACSCRTQQAARLGQGGGDLHPGLCASPQVVERFQDAKVGLSIHWGPSSLGGREIGWSRGREIPREQYDQFYQQFNPTNFDADAWCRFMEEAGFRYCSPTSKHHDGFSLWFSRVSKYDMEATPFHRDVMRELSEACRRHHILFGAYYSILDWYHPDWPEHKRGEPGPLFGLPPDAPQLPRYVDYVKAQCGELIRDYRVQFLQFDGEWDACWTHELGEDLYASLRGLSPDVLFNSRVDKGRENPEFKRTHNWDRQVYAGDFEDRERVVGQDNSVLGRADHAWQAWVTVDKTQWSHNPRSDKKLLTPEYIIRDLIATICDNGNYMINLGPRPDGAFDPEEAAIVLRAGRWIRAHGEAIYGTRGGPYPQGDWGGSVRKGRQVFLFLTDATRQELALPSPGVTVKKVRTLDGVPVPYTDDGRKLTLNLSGIRRDPVATVLVLELSKPLKTWINP